MSSPSVEVSASEATARPPAVEALALLQVGISNHGVGPGAGGSGRVAS